jgi:hypothetical protein
MRNITPGSPQTADIYGQAQLGVLRSPIAALGFDPRAAALDTKTGKEVSLAGIYSPKSDNLYANVAFPSTLVHESVHRGLEKLRGAGVLTPALEKRLPEEEMIVRFIMSSEMGDPEKEHGANGSKQRNQSLMEFGRDLKDPKAPGEWLVPSAKTQAAHLDALKELTDKAAAYYAKQRPGGPR